MESKEHLEADKQCDCIVELRKKYQYVDRFTTYSTFPELQNPVMDSQGLIREKDEPNITKSLHNPEEKVIIIDSPDLKKIQKDIQKLEISYCKKKVKISDLKNIVMDQNAKWEKQVARWDEHSKNTDLRITKLEQTIDSQNQHIENFIEIIKEKDKKIVHIEEENTALKNEIDEKNRIIEGLEKDQEENDLYAGMDNIELTWKRPNYLPDAARWRDRNIHIGIKHTFFDEDYPREKQENNFRRLAYEGNVQRLRELLEIDNTLVNGRGMPDSFGSAIRAWKDKTPLMLAAQNGHKECVRVLLAHGAHLDYLDRDKWTALDYAEENNHESVAVFLKKRGAQNGRYLKNIFENKKPTEIELSGR